MQHSKSSRILQTTKNSKWKEKTIQITALTHCYSKNRHHYAIIVFKKKILYICCMLAVHRSISISHCSFIAKSNYQSALLNVRLHRHNFHTIVLLYKRHTTGALCVHTYDGAKQDWKDDSNNNSNNNDSSNSSRSNNSWKQQQCFQITSATA